MDRLKRYSLVIISVIALLNYFSYHFLRTTESIEIALLSWLWFSLAWIGIIFHIVRACSAKMKGKKEYLDHIYAALLILASYGVFILALSRGYVVFPSV